jgi:hypothetical protein
MGCLQRLARRCIDTAGREMMLRDQYVDIVDIGRLCPRPDMYTREW